MRDNVYTWGYGGKSPQDLKDILDKIEGVVWDVRLSPRSRQPGWNKGNLQKLLGDRYVHVPQFGNLNYKSGGGIRIKDFTQGVRMLREETRPVLMMCVCKNAATCHRTRIAELLAYRDMNVREYSDVLDDEDDQPILF